MQFQSIRTVHLDQSNLREIVLRLLLKGVELHQDMFRILHVGPNLSSFLYCQDPCGIFPWTSMQNLNSSPPFLCIALKSWTLVNFPPELLFPLRYSLQVVRDSIWELYSGSTARKHEKLFKTGPLLKSFDDWIRSGAALRSALTAALVYLFCNGVLLAKEDEPPKHLRVRDLCNQGGRRGKNWRFDLGRSSRMQIRIKL